MNEVLIEQLIQWFITGILDFKANDATYAQFRPMIVAALSENRNLTDDEWAQVHAAAQAAHDDAANA
jgi:hypothetical protein